MVPRPLPELDSARDTSEVAAILGERVSRYEEAGHRLSELVQPTREQLQRLQGEVWSARGELKARYERASRAYHGIWWSAGAMVPAATGLLGWGAGPLTVAGVLGATAALVSAIGVTAYRVTQAAGSAKSCGELEMRCSDRAHVLRAEKDVETRLSELRDAEQRRRELVGMAERKTPAGAVEHTGDAVVVGGIRLQRRA
jgi:hypothetical protein